MSRVCIRKKDYWTCESKYWCLPWRSRSWWPTSTRTHTPSPKRYSILEIRPIHETLPSLSLSERVKIKDGFTSKMAPKKQMTIQTTAFVVTLSSKKTILKSRTSSPFMLRMTETIEIGIRLRDWRKHMAPTLPMHMRMRMIFMVSGLFGKNECFHY